MDIGVARRSNLGGGRTRVAAAAPLLAIALGAAGCRYETNLHLPPPGAPPVASPHLQVQRKYDPTTGRLISEVPVLIYPDRFPLKHGKALGWYASGAKEWEREYERGEPSGMWRRWYEDGALRSEVTFEDGPHPTVMTFWHPNGRMSAQGLAKKGVREGVWKFWHADGRLAEQGAYIDSLREGAWQSWSADGTELFESRFEHNIRVEHRAVPVDPSSAAPAEVDAAIHVDVPGEVPP